MDAFQDIMIILIYSESVKKAEDESECKNSMSAKFQIMFYAFYNITENSKTRGMAYNADLLAPKKANKIYVCKIVQIQL